MVLSVLFVVGSCEPGMQVNGRSSLASVGATPESDGGNVHVCEAPATHGEINATKALSVFIALPCRGKERAGCVGESAQAEGGRNAIDARVGLLRSFPRRSVCDVNRSAVRSEQQAGRRGVRAESTRAADPIPPDPRERRKDCGGQGLFRTSEPLALEALSS